MLIKRDCSLLRELYFHQTRPCRNKVVAPVQPQSEPEDFLVQSHGTKYEDELGFPSLLGLLGSAEVPAPVTFPTSHRGAFRNLQYSVNYLPGKFADTW